MIGTGWEIWGIKASLLLVSLFAAVIALMVRVMTREIATSGHHLDDMAGDEGED